ncbi:MAG TPA: MMPL family transporter [Kofleriaceae bacterium]|nr:MMPL family transporter [Kofleriaceae bacterium]
MPDRNRSARYVGWLARHTRAVFAGAALAVAAAAYLVIFHLPLKSDLAYLLPGDAPSVRDAEALAARMPARDVMLMIVRYPDTAVRAAAGQLAIDGARALDPSLVERVEADDSDVRAFIGAHRHLFVPLEELREARAALDRHIEQAKLRANPLFIDLDDAPAAPTAEPPELARLRAKRRDAEAALGRSAYVSADGQTQVLAIRTAFAATDIERDRQLMAQLEALAGQIRAAHPGVEIGFAGGAPVTIAEHAALVRGIVLSSLITALLVALVVYAYFRRARLLALLGINIAAGTLLALGTAALTVGHLNAATAFLGAIIAGNGVNYGILLVARYLEERRAQAPAAAMATALATSLVPTLVASLGAALAFGALAVTQFRGFADFARIGGAGMLVCWISSFVLLPALVLRFSPSGPEPSPWFGRLVVRVFAVRRPAVALAVAGAVVLASGAVAWRFVANDPYEYDLTQLRSDAPDARTAREWLRISNEAVGRGLAGMGGQTYVALDRPEQVPAVVEALRARAAIDPTVGRVTSILDVVPPDQAARLAELAALRAGIDQIAPELPDTQRAELLALRPPDDLRAITAADLPPSIARRLTEKNGDTGLIVAVRPGARFDEQDGRDLIQFAASVRDVKLPGGETASAAGAAVLFADVLLQIQEDGPLVTWIAALGIALMVLAVAGRSRRAAAALAATFAGSLVMVAASALGGLRITFLDFVALPITLGLGVDYAINVAARAADDDPVVALRSTGGAVLLCSLTTMIGYLSLLASDNLAIRGFGIASLLGELTCMAAAFVIVPAVIAMKLPPLTLKNRHRAELIAPGAE